MARLDHLCNEKFGSVAPDCGLSQTRSYCVVVVVPRAAPRRKGREATQTHSQITATCRSGKRPRLAGPRQSSETHQVMYRIQIVMQELASCL